MRIFRDVCRICIESNRLRRESHRLVTVRAGSPDRTCARQSSGVSSLAVAVVGGKDDACAQS
jgi:hypothetical protein